MSSYTIGAEALEAAVKALSRMSKSEREGLIDGFYECAGIVSDPAGPVDWACRQCGALLSEGELVDLVANMWAACDGLMAVSRRVIGDEFLRTHQQEYTPHHHVKMWLLCQNMAFRTVSSLERLPPSQRKEFAERCVAAFGQFHSVVSNPNGLSELFAAWKDGKEMESGTVREVIGKCVGFHGPGLNPTRGGGLTLARAIAMVSGKPETFEELTRQLNRHSEYDCAGIVFEIRVALPRLFPLASS